jgi:hypothetical protein
MASFIRIIFLFGTTIFLKVNKLTDGHKDKKIYRHAKDRQTDKILFLNGRYKNTLKSTQNFSLLALSTAKNWFSLEIWDEGIEDFQRNHKTIVDQHSMYQIANFPFFNLTLRLFNLSLAGWVFCSTA